MSMPRREANHLLRALFEIASLHVLKLILLSGFPSILLEMEESFDDMLQFPPLWTNINKFLNIFSLQL